MSKLTDYGIVLLTHFAHEKSGAPLNARTLAERTGVPLPTVGKILKILSKGEVLEASRGPYGGYQLSEEPQKISIADVIRLLEGPISITECSTGPQSSCELEGNCPVRSHWRKINGAVTQALEGLTLADMGFAIATHKPAAETMRNAK